MESFISIPLVAVDQVANSNTVSKNVRFVEDYGTPTASEIAQFSTAASFINIVKDNQAASTRASRYLTTLTPTQIAAAIAAANTNTPGLGSGGKVTLVAGTAAVTIPGLTTSNVGLVSLITPANGSLSVKFSGSATAADTFTITALLAAGTINTADTSVIGYSIVA